MNDLKRTILIVEDEESIGFLLQQNLEFEGYEAIWAKDGEQGLLQAETQAPDLILLDLMLPKMSGMEVCKRLRAKGDSVPIIMLTAKGEQIDKVIGLKTGADDYITKPFDILELTARIEAIFRRIGKQTNFNSELKIRDLEIDFLANCIRRNGEEMPLTQVESQLLKYFVHQEGNVLTREQIMEDVWGHDYLLSTRTIDTHVTHLRQKIEINPAQPRHIVTIHRVGYKFIKNPG
jgi:two-component system alkaline phosphatase synthesis response regulator PhoP